MPAGKKPDSLAAPVPRPARRAFHIAVAAYALWLVFLTVLVIIQHTL